MRSGKLTDKKQRSSDRIAKTESDVAPAGLPMRLADAFLT